MLYEPHFIVVSDKPFIMRIQNDPNPRPLRPEHETENVADQDFSREEDTFNEAEGAQEKDLTEEQEEDNDEARSENL